jgi:hypothetical protein
MKKYIAPTITMHLIEITRIICSSDSYTVDTTTTNGVSEGNAFTQAASRESLWDEDE